MFRTTPCLRLAWCVVACLIRPLGAAAEDAKGDRSRAQDGGSGIQATAEWRDETINRIRGLDLGSFDYHAFRTSSRQLLLADYLAGRIDASALAASEASADFVDLYGMNRAIEGVPVDWLATSSDQLERERSSYGGFSISIPLASGYWKTGDITYLRAWFSILGDFARNQRAAVERLPPGERRDENAPWLLNGLSCLHQSERVIVIAKCLAAFAKSLPSGADGSKPDWSNVLRPVSTPANQDSLGAISPDDLAALVRSLTRDHPQLLLDAYYPPGGLPNQRLQGITALLTIAAMFPDEPGMNEIARKAGEAMTEYLATSFYADGGMLEQSLNYTVSQAERLREIGRMLRPTPPPWLHLLADRVRGFDRFMVGIATPLLELPIIGNNSSNPPAAWTGDAVRTAWFERKRREGPKIDGNDLAFASIAFPYSGYYVQRRDWKWDSPYLFFANARPARGHQSRDNLAIELHAYGRPLLVRGGSPPYGVKFLGEKRQADLDKIEEYLGEKSSFKLNTVVVDGYSQSRSGKPADSAYETPIPGRWHTTNAFDLVDGTYDLGYGPPGDAEAVDQAVSHERRVIHVRDLRCWVVSDAMHAKDRKKHSFTQVWKFPPLRGANDGHNAPVYGFAPEQVACGDGSIRTLDPNGPNLWLYHFSNQPISYQKYCEATDPYRGWYARFIGDLIPAVDVHATWQATDRSVVTTLLWPTPGGAPPPIKSFVATGVEPAQDTSSFNATLKNGATLAFAESRGGPRRLEACGIKVLGEMLLVTRQGRSVRGLALGCKEWTDGRYKIKPKQTDFEFVCLVDGGFDTVASIGTPRGFLWKDGDHGIMPDYSAAARATRPGADSMSSPAVEIARVPFPDAVRTTEGDELPMVGLCGVAWLGGDRYVAAPREGESIVVFRMPVDDQGKPRAVVEPQVTPGGGFPRRTDVAFNVVQQRMIAVNDLPPAIQTFPIKNSGIGESLSIPPAQLAARAGKGLAAATYDPSTSSVWISNREALVPDGLPAVGRLGTDVRLTELSADADRRSPSAGTNPVREVRYRVDPAHGGRRFSPGASSSGVTAVAAVGDGRLLVLEASRAPTLPRFRNRLYLVDLSQASDFEASSSAATKEDLPAVPKTLIWEQAGGVCLEGMCLGPTLGNGDRVIVAAGDNSSLGTPTSLVVLRWTPSDRRAWVPWAGWWAVTSAVVCGALVIWRVVAKAHLCVGRRQASNQTSTARLLAM
jgi:hypothetical protein